MPEVGLQDLRSGLRARDVSPDSVIFTGETNFSLFSSASASVERCSFASDVPDQEDSINGSHLAGHELSEVMSGPDPDPNKSIITVHSNKKNNSNNNSAIALSTREKTKDSSEDETLPARTSFSRAIKECQDRRLRSELLLKKKADRRRHASLDLNTSLINSANSSSPRFGVMKKPIASLLSSSRKAAAVVAFPSPGTPNYRHTSVSIVQKGWSSERVPSHTNQANRRSMNAALFLPYNNGGRTLPSKWEDAERWIFSPVSGDGGARTSFQQQPQRRPKSKSGPLGPPGVAYYQMFSPAAAPAATNSFDLGGNKVIGNSPFSAGVMSMNSSSSAQYRRCEGSGNFLVGTEPCMARSISIHGCSELLMQSSLPGEQHDEITDEGSTNQVSRAVSRRDMATQMSPESSARSSPSIRSIIEFSNAHSSKQEIRDVPIDERVMVTKWSRKHKGKNPQSGNQNEEGWKRKALSSFHSSGWEMATSTETSKSISKSSREEAKITAWENLQKAKAEASIRKLEMKLEKKRASSMDKIMKKLRCAQKKANDMRSSMVTNSINHQIPSRPFDRALSFRRTRPIGSLSGCFTCHAF